METVSTVLLKNVRPGTLVTFSNSFMFFFYKKEKLSGFICHLIITSVLIFTYYLA